MTFGIKRASIQIPTTLLTEPWFPFSYNEDKDVYLEGRGEDKIIHIELRK